MRFSFALLALLFLCAARSQGPHDDPLAGVFAKREAVAKSNAKDWSAAETAWEKVTALNPTDAGAWLELGRSRYELKKYLEAVEPLQKADDLGVSYPSDMPYFEACCYALAGKKKEALDKLQKAIDAGYRDLEQARTDDDLASLRNDGQYRRLVDLDDVSKMDRVQGITHDVRFYQRELKRLDYRARNLGGIGVDRFADRFVQEIPHLSDNQVLVRFMEMAALARDGHTSLRPATNDPDGLPVQFASYGDGIFILGAAPQYKDLIGSKLISIDGHNTEELISAVSKLFGYENSQWIEARAPGYLRKPRCLNGLGLAPSDKQVTVVVEKEGGTRTVTLPADSKNADGNWVTYHDLVSGAPPLCFKNRAKLFWYEYLPDSMTVYFQFNGVGDEEKQTLADFSKELFAFIDSHDVDKLIVDCRFNGGGNNFLNKPLLLDLIKSKLNSKGHLFVLIGKDTFSAAMCFVAQVERFTNAIFAGEPTGSSPNFIGESIPVVLRYTKIRGTISDLYWQNSVAMDHRVWISPQIYVPPTFEAYSNNQDPVLDAVLAYKP